MEIRERYELHARRRLAELHEDLHREQDQARRIHEAQFNNLLSLLELEATELRALLEQDQTIAAVGEARGVAVEEIVEVMARPIQRKIAAAVKEGDVGPQEARERLREVRRDIEHHVRGQGPVVPEMGPAG